MKNLHRVMLAAALSLAAGSAFAHQGSGVAGGFASGFAHPLHGGDHAIAMVAVGLWAALLGRRAIWVLPLVFPMVMALGGALGISGLHIAGVETGIALSAVVLGAMIAFAARPSLRVAGAIVAAFAIFHGYAHGVELPQATDPVAYGFGFIAATGLLHLAGIAFGLMVRWPAGQAAVRSGGATIALAGTALLMRLMLV